MNAKEEKEPKGLSTIIGIIALVLVGSRFLNEFGVQVDTGMVCMILAGIMVLLIGVRSWRNHRIWAVINFVLGSVILISWASMYLPALIGM